MRTARHEMAYRTLRPRVYGMRIIRSSGEYRRHQLLVFHEVNNWNSREITMEHGGGRGRMYGRDTRRRAVTYFLSLLPLFSVYCSCSTVSYDSSALVVLRDFAR